MFTSTSPQLGALTSPSRHDRATHDLDRLTLDMRVRGSHHGSRSFGVFKSLSISPSHRTLWTPLGSARPLSAATTPRQKQVIFSGIQPTGIPHLGNHLGAIRQWVDLQNNTAPSSTLIYSIVDLHAITARQDADNLRAWKRQTLGILLAAGLDPDRSTIFYQSDVRIVPQIFQSSSSWTAGASAYRTHVDPQLYSFHWIPVTDDPLEGKYVLYYFSQRLFKLKTGRASYRWRKSLPNRPLTSSPSSSLVCFRIPCYKQPISWSIGTFLAFGCRYVGSPFSVPRMCPLEKTKRSILNLRASAPRLSITPMAAICHCRRQSWVSILHGSAKIDAF